MGQGFLQVIRSVAPGGREIELLREVGLYQEGTETYEHKRIFSHEELKRILVIFLHNQLALSYESLDRKKSLQLLDLLEKYDPDYFREERVGSIRMKLRWLAPIVIKKLRSFSRK